VRRSVKEYKDRNPHVSSRQWTNAELAVEFNTPGKKTHWKSIEPQDTFKMKQILKETYYT
jgi:hypothetical protein